MKKSPLNKLLLVCLLVGFIILSRSPAFSVIEVKTAPNYLILLVHGVNSSSRIFVGQDKGGNKGEKGSDLTNEPAEKDDYGDLKGYLENDLGLKGYVYSYTFSQRDGEISDQGKELGEKDYVNPASDGSDLNYVTGDHLKHIDSTKTKINNGRCWFEQAREDFKDWFKTKGPGSKERPARPPIEEEIPKKYILIAHSMGGLSAREYIFSNYYDNDVATLITIDTPHMGSNAAWMLKQIKEFDSNGKAAAASVCLISGLLASVYHVTPLDIYLYMCGILGYGFQEMVIDRWLADNNFGWYYGQPAVQDMDVDSNYIKLLATKGLKSDADGFKIRIIAGKGVPTPPINFVSAGKYVMGLSAFETLFSSSFWNEIPDSGKFMSLWLSTLFGTPINDNGDFMVQKSSQLAEGVQSFNDPRIDLKKYEYEFDETASGIKDAIEAIMLAADTAYFIGGGNYLFRTAIIILGVGELAMRVNEIGKDGYLDAHGTILKRVYETKIIDHALEDIVTLGGKADTLKSSGGAVHAFAEVDISKPTAGFTAPEQAFALLSNKNKDGSDAGAYHTITIEAITESNNHLQSAPIYFNGPPSPDGLRRTSEKKWISGVTVKEAPTAIKGVINTFLPKKLKSFEYSENFAAWKPVGTVDEWGNFTLSGLNMAEGQNVIAFRAESWIGNKMNQILNFTINTIPMLPSDFAPAPNSYTNNNMPIIKVQFSKSAYSNSPLENISISIAKLIFQDGMEKDVSNNPNFKFTISGGQYDRKGLAEYVPDAPLPDGKYTMLIVANSNVGMAQALWPFTIDTTPPVVKFMPQR